MGECDRREQADDKSGDDPLLQCVVDDGGRLGSQNEESAFVLPKGHRQLLRLQRQIFLRPDISHCALRAALERRHVSQWQHKVLLCLGREIDHQDCDSALWKRLAPQLGTEQLARYLLRHIITNYGYQF
jgi:hypothetical protein|eukprot:COSAG01_NODE_2159_length_8277_cov_416.997065_7_plen_129_part_00